MGWCGWRARRGCTSSNTSAAPTCLWSAGMPAPKRFFAVSSRLRIGRRYWARGVPKRQYSPVMVLPRPRNRSITGREHRVSKHLLLVAGSGRSGTSLFASVVGNLGFYVPRPRVKPDDSNPRGFGEPQWVVDRHTQYLRQANVHASDARPTAWADTARICLDEQVSTEVRLWLEEQFSGHERPPQGLRTVRGSARRLDPADRTRQRAARGSFPGERAGQGTVVGRQHRRQLPAPLQGDLGGSRRSERSDLPYRAGVGG